MESQTDHLEGDRARATRFGGLPTGLVIPLFGAGIFVAAGLVFLLEPMIAKALLPTFGGAPQVWTAATVFFQAALLAGYGYAHLSTTRFGPRRGPLLHLALLAAPVLLLPIAIRGGALVEGAPPALAVVGILALSIGAPFIVASATSPLLQRWLSTIGHPGFEDPYFLYAAGNAGSLIGLLAYPFIVEPRFTVREQAILWSAGYIVFALLVGTVGAVVARTARASPAAGVVDRATDEAILRGVSSLDRRRQLRWIVRAFIPASLLLGVTNHLQTDIAAVPLLWVIPLAIYLLTFVLAFARRTLLPPRTAAALLPLAAVAILFTFLYAAAIPTPVLMAIHYGTFFIVAMLSHGQLAQDRPGAEHLTRFYLLLAVGGALGGLFNAIVAPQLFD
ncbi:MAG TPA: hypothetical protein VIF63_04170, partial [Candidatus Limnocylindrales bacterium]